MINIFDGMLYEGWDTSLTINLEGVESGIPGSNHGQGIRDDEKYLVTD